MSTTGLELSSFINPKLTWKTVSKGRTTSRRSRRPALKNSKMGHEENKSPKRVQSQVSESVKASGIARRFGDSMEHIPIKKRRFLFRSPSPTPQSPRDESGEELEKSSSVPDQLTAVVPKKMENDSSNVEASVGDAYDSAIDGEKMKATDEICGCDDDFSGIAILAAAACIDMLDKPSTDTMNAFDESVTKLQTNSPKEHIVDGSLPASISATSQTTEQPNTSPASRDDRTSPASRDDRTSPASRDDRLHWDLNAPMDEWDHPLDDTNHTIVDSAMKLQTATVDCLVKTEQANVFTRKEPTLQPSIGGLNTSETPNVSVTELAQRGDFHTGNSGLTGEALLELTRTGSNISQNQVDDGVGTFKQHCIGPSSSMEDKSIPSDISHVPVVDRVESVDHCLRLGSSDTKTSLSLGKSMATTSDHQDVSKEGSASAVQVDKTEKSVMDLLLEPVSREANFDIDNAPCEFMKTKTMNIDETKNKLPEHPFQSLQHYPMPPEKQELALSTVRAYKFSEIKTEMIIAMDQPSDANQLDAKKCETNSMQTSDLEKDAFDIRVSSYEDIVAPEKKNELGCTSCDLGDGAQPVDESCPVGSKSANIDLKHADISGYSGIMESGGASTSNDGKSAKVACGVEMKNESGIVVGYEAQIDMKVESIAKDIDNQVIVPSSHLEVVPYVGSSDRILQLQVSTEGCGQVVSTGLEGGYDSYLEDGELREHHWVDNDEKIVAEVCEKQGNQLHEHLRCDDQLPAVEKNIEEDHSCPHQDSFLVGVDAGEDSLKANPSTSNSIFMNQLSAMDNPEVVDMDLDDGRKPSAISDDHKEDQNDSFKDIGDVYIDGSGIKDSRRELQSQIEGPLSTYRRGTHFTPRSRYRNFNHSYYRDERQIGVDESFGRGRSLHPDCGGRLGNRYWNRGSRNIGSDPVTEGADDKFVGPSDDESLGGHQQQGMFPGSRVGCTHLARKGSPAARAEEYDMGLVKGRDVSSENGQRNRYDRPLPGLSRGPREGYRGPIYDTPNSSSSMSNHFMKREQSFSPGGSRIDPHPPRNRRRSRSRSRTHSPDLRPDDDRMNRMRAPYQNPDYFRERRAPFRVFGQNQRFDPTSGRLRSENCVRPGTRPVRFLDGGGPPSGRPHEYENDDCKRKTYAPRNYRRSRSKSRSCSPEFRNEARMGRMRLPYAENGPTRDHMTDRRSPPRMFNSGKRFDNVGSPPSRLRSGDYMRPIGRPIRFQDNAQSSRGNEYEGDDYRRKPRTIFDRIRPTRNFDMEGDGRRFEYDAEDGNPNQNFNRGGDSYARGTDRRPADVVRGAREETSNARYNSDRIYSTGPKPFGNREYSDDALNPRRMRPE